MKFPVVLTKEKDRHGDRVYEAFCPLFHDARTFSPCDDKHDAVEEVQEIVQDNVDELLDARQPLPTLPKADELKKKYKDAKVYWVKIETDEETDDEDDYDGEDDDEDDETQKETDEDLDDLSDDDEDDDSDEDDE